MTGVQFFAAGLLELSLMGNARQQNLGAPLDLFELILVRSVKVLLHFWRQCNSGFSCCPHIAVHHKFDFLTLES